VKFDTFRRLYCWLLTLPNRILNLCRGQKTRGEKWIPCLAESQGRILYVRNMINRAIKHTSGEGSGALARTLLLIADDAWRRDTIAFPDSRIICQRPSDAKNSKSILSYVPTICSRSSIIRQQYRWPTRAGSLRSESLSPFLFSLLFFFIIATGATFLMIERREDLYRELKGWFVLRIRFDIPSFLRFWFACLGIWR